MASELPPAPVTMYIDTVRQMLVALARLPRIGGGCFCAVAQAQSANLPNALAAQLLRENEVFVQAVHEAQREGRVREMAIYLERLTSSVARLGKLMDLQTLCAAQLPERREVRPVAAHKGRQGNLACVARCSCAGFATCSQLPARAALAASAAPRGGTGARGEQDDRHHGHNSRRGPGRPVPLCGCGSGASPGPGSRRQPSRCPDTCRCPVWCSTAARPFEHSIRVTRVSPAQQQQQQQ